MLLDGHSPTPIIKHLNFPRTNLIYKWKQKQVQAAGPVADSMDARLRELQTQLYRVEHERDILTNFGHLRPQRLADLYVIAQSDDQTDVASITQICKVLGISRRTYYAWLESKETQKVHENQVIAPQVHSVFMQHHRRYGSWRVAKTVATMGLTCDRRRAIRIIESQGLRAIQPKSFKPRSTESKHRLGFSPNLLLIESATGIGQVWVGNMRYIPCQECSFCYLAVLMDLYSRRIVGWHLSQDMTEELIRQALRNAIADLQPAAGIIHHNDHGGQYSAKEYRKILARARMRQNMSRADDCYNNATNKILLWNN